jgi:hypothetical protein
VDAFDAKGISANTAGVAGQSSQGRAEIMQQRARALLNQLFGESNNDNNTNRNNNYNPRGGRNRRQNGNRRESEVRNNNSLDSNYTTTDDTGVTNGPNTLFMNYEQFNVNQNLNRPSMPTNTINNNNFSNSNYNDGIYIHEGGGMYVVDDDENPGLRAGLDLNYSQTRNQAERTTTNYVPNYSSIANGTSTGVTTSSHNFPPLPTTGTNTTTAQAKETGKSSNEMKQESKRGGVSRTLAVIGSLVKKTDPKEIEKQQKAREEFLRKLEYTTMSYQDIAIDQSAINSGFMRPTSNGQDRDATDGMLERNRNLASALGVTPSTIRDKFSGWSRSTSNHVNYDEFGNELNRASYPDSLIIKARERMTELLKLET